MEKINRSKTLVVKSGNNCNGMDFKTWMSFNEGITKRKIKDGRARQWKGGEECESNEKCKKE